MSFAHIRAPKTSHAHSPALELGVTTTWIRLVRSSLPASPAPSVVPPSSSRPLSAAQLAFRDLSHGKNGKGGKKGGAKGEIKRRCCS